MPPPTKENVLDLPLRRRIVECVEANPGLHLRGIAEQMDVALSTLEYHTYQLLRTGHLVTREDAGYKAFYPAEGMDRRDKDILYLLRQEGPRRICAHVLLHQGCTPKDLKEALQTSGATLSFHLKKLLEGGVVRDEKAGRTKHLFIDDDERVANVLVTYRKSFVDDAVDRFADAWMSLGR